MGIILAIIIAFSYNQIVNSKLALGGYNLKTTFWGFGVIGGGILISIGCWYILGKLETDQSRGGFWTLGAIKAVAVVLVAYSYTVFLGIWKSSKNATFILKLASRYLSLFLIGVIMASLYLSWLYFLIAGVIVFFVNKKVKNKQSKVIEQNN
jgi:hypothetical protein